VPQGGLPLLVIDAWEHAYYPQYHTDLAKFFNALWNIWDWDGVAARFDRLRRVDLAIRDAADRAAQDQQMQH
jgi:Fe-Mn family superoxide dismutase